MRLTYVARVFALAVLTCVPVASALVPASSQRVSRGEDNIPQKGKAEIVADARVGSQVLKGQLLVTLHAGVKADALKTIFEGLNAKYEVIDRIESLNHFTIATDHDRLAELRQRLSNHPYVAGASFNTLVELQQDPPGLLKPTFNDSVFRKPEGMLEDKDNWNLYRIKANEAWSITTGGALIAVIDTGCKNDHEELTGRTVNPWSYAINPDHREGMKKFRRTDGSIYEAEVRDHGTHVAITAAGTSNNSVGTVGVAPNSPVIPIQVLYYTPSPANDGTGVVNGKTNEICAGLERAINGGAAVVNMSLGANFPPEILKRWRDAATAEARLDVEREMMPGVQRDLEAYSPLLDLANQRGVIVVVSAGNQNMPAHLYALPLSRRVITVANTTREDKRSSSSNYGPYTTVSAPGNQIYSGIAQPMKAYDYLSGTSMAAPHVAGVVALMKTIDPELRLADVTDILIRTGRTLETDQPIGPLVNAKAALEETRRRLALRARQPILPPLVPPPVENPTLPELPPDAIAILRRPDPWNNRDVQRIIEVWLSIALPAPANPGQGVWVFDRFGRVINVRVFVTNPPPVWGEFRFRWLWENALLLESRNMGTLYEFIVGTLRQGRFNPAPPRVPENFRPRPTDPRPPARGLPFDPILVDTKWKGRNGKGEEVEFEFTAKFVTITRGKNSVRYTVRINTFVSPITVDLFPDGGGEPILCLLQMTGFGELLFRTDFNNKRPASIARGDPLVFVLTRTDVTITNPGKNADGVEMPILFKGTEAQLRNLDPHKKLDPKSLWGALGNYSLHHYSLSRDGQRVWLMLLKADSKEEPWQLWSMRTDGTDAKKSTFAKPEKGVATPTVVTNGDGSVAWIVWPRQEPFQDPFHLNLQQVAPGGTAKVVAEMVKLKNITGGWEPRVTTDGKKLYFIAEEGIIEVRDDGHAKNVMTFKNLTYKGHKSSLNRLFILAIDGTGTNWVTATHFLPPKATQPMHVVIRGNADGAKEFHEEKDLIQRLAMSDDGRTVLVQRAGAHLSHVLLWREGKIRPITADTQHFQWGTLSGDGNTLYAVNQMAGGATGRGMIEDLTTGQRHRVMNNVVLGIPDWGAVQLNRDGKLLVSSYDFYHGLYVYRANAEAPTHYPQIKSVRQRYEGNKLVITAEFSAPDALGEIRVIPLKYGYAQPLEVVAERAHNPLIGLFVGVHMTPVPKRPGVFEVVTEVGPQAVLDDSYSFRIVVANEDRNRATFQDFSVLR